MAKKGFNYGYVHRGTKAYRNALRSCKLNQKLYGVGFDYTELWSLDISFYKFLLKNQIIKSDWLKYKVRSLDDIYIKKKYGFDEHIELKKAKTIEERKVIYEKYQEYVEKEQNQILNYISVIFDEFPKDKEKIVNFLVPRLLALKDLTYSYPCNMTSEDWKNLILQCVYDLKMGNIQLFLTNIDSFWT